MRGDGHVYQRGRIWWIVYSFRGKQYAESSKSADKRTAQKLLRQRLRQINKPRFVNPAREEKFTIGDLKQQLVDSYQRKQNRSTETMLACFAHVEKAFQFDRLVDIDTEKIRAYSAARLKEGAARGTVNQELRYFKAGYRLMLKAKMISDMPEFEFNAGETVREGFLTFADFRALLAEVKNSNTADLIEFLYHSAWRSNEVKELRWSWIDLAKNMVVLPEGKSKSKKPRTLPLVGTLLDIIERRMKLRRLDCPFVFHRNGKQIRWFRNSFQSAAKTIGQSELLPHDMRRSAVRNFREAGLSEKAGMALSGHATRSVFDRYSIVSDEDKVASMQRVQEWLKKQAKVRRVVPIKRESA
jgi:integrase